MVLASSLVLSACAFLPGVPEDQPLSLAVRDGTPILSWCAPSAEIVRVRVYYGTMSADDAELVIDARGRLPVAPGAEVTPDRLPEEWIVERHDDAGAELSEIGVIVDYQARDAEGELVEGSFGADFESENASDIGSWPENEWIWANGTVSTDPCGMPSAHGAVPHVDVSEADLVGVWTATSGTAEFELHEGGGVSAEDWPASMWCDAAPDTGASFPSLTGQWSAGYGDSSIAFSLNPPCNAMPALFAFESELGAVELWYFAPGVGRDSHPDPEVVFKRSG